MYIFKENPINISKKVIHSIAIVDKYFPKKVGTKLANIKLIPTVQNVATVYHIPGFNQYKHRCTRGTNEIK